MTNCSNIPTPESTADFDLDSRCFSEVMTSDEDYTTAKASDGNNKKTLAAAFREITSINKHNELSGRSDEDCHPTTAITFSDGRTLEEVLQEILNGGTEMTNYYSFLTPEKEVSDTSIGYGGSTWHVFPTTVGRNEGGKSVIYHGTTYESPDDKTSDNPNKVQGEAIISVKRVEIEYSPVEGQSPLVTFTEHGINKGEISYLADEHHQPAVFDNATTGQLITAWGSRNGAIPSDEGNKQHIRYGKDTFTLGSVEDPSTTSVPNYAQFFNTGNTVFLWSRNNVNQWVYSKGPGGQNFVTESKVFLDAGSGTQYYLNNKYVSSIECGGTDSQELRSRVHCFGQSHPTISPDNEIRYTMGTFVSGGTYDEVFTQSGLIYQNPTSGNFTKDNGKLGEMDTLSPADLELAYQIPVGKTGRILDVQTGFAPRALLCVFDKTWSHGDPIPLGTTWDLVMIEFNEFEKSWRSMNIKTGIRGALGYKPWSGTASDHGNEGFTSFYATGACFYRGKNGYDVKPTIYLAERIGGDINQHRLTEVNLNSDYTTVDSERDLTPVLLPKHMVDFDNLADGIPTYKKGIKGSSQVIYRPDSIFGGDQRGLIVNMATGWSDFNSFTATDNIVLLDYDKVAPTFTTQTNAIVTTNGTKVRFGANVEVIGGETPELVWQADTGTGWTDLSGPSQNWRENTFYTAANGNKYRLKATTSAGVSYSSEILVTVS